MIAQKEEKTMFGGGRFLKRFIAESEKVKDVFSKIEFNCYKPILENIIREGMFRMIKEITQKERKADE